MQIREIECHSALHKSALYDIDYALNPYRGCTHGCLYCYSPYVLNEERPWGKFLDVRINIPNVLARELKSMPKGTVGIGTVTDPYQPAEVEYRLTRYCLEVLRRHSFQVSIQTKSDLVIRDLDLLESMDAEVGFTLTTLDRRTASIYQPGAPSPHRVLEALEHLSKRGVFTYVFIGPILPGVSEKDLKEIVKQSVQKGASRIYADFLRLRTKERFSTLPSQWKSVLKDGYGKQALHHIKDACQEYGIEFSTSIWKEFKLVHHY